MLQEPDHELVREDGSGSNEKYDGRGRENPVHDGGRTTAADLPLSKHVNIQRVHGGGLSLCGQD